MERSDIWVAILKLFELSTVPHSPPISRARYLLIDHGVTQLVVENWPNPANCCWFEKLSCDHDLAAPNVARRENALLPTSAPHDAVRIKVRAIWEEFLPEAAPYFAQEGVAPDALPLWSRARTK